jgi:hypothetical protein
MSDTDSSRFGLDAFELYNIARAYRKNIYRLIKQLPPAGRCRLSVANYNGQWTMDN